jgi:hypothetical protein
MNFILTGNIKKTDTSGNNQVGYVPESSQTNNFVVEVSSEEATRNVTPLPNSSGDRRSPSELVEQRLLGTEAPLPETSTNSFVDKLTMEYMMNRTHYKKYLAKTDTNKFQRLNEQLLYIQDHEEDIEEITTNLLQDFIRHGNFTKYNTIINTAFEEFLYTCVGYIKDVEYNNQNTDENI